jgi:hypothetical protein
MATHRKKKRNSGLKDAVSLVTAVALVVIAVLMVLFVYMYIKNSSGGIFSFLNDRGEEQTENTDVDATAPEEIELNLSDTKGQTGLVEDGAGNLIYVLESEESGRYDSDSKFKTQDGQEILKNTWIGLEKGLYYFDEKGHAAEETVSEGAYKYSFGDDQTVSSISYNTGYRPDTSAGSDDYPSLVQSKTVWAYLSDTKKLGDFSAVMYKKTTESLSHTLGGNSNPQYASPYTLSIHDGYIYFIARSREESGGPYDAIANRLFRMKPGADIRELAAEHVEGYKVASDVNGQTVVYWYDGQLMHRTGEFTEDDTVVTFPEDGNYYIDLDYDPGNAVLMLEGGHPVRLETDAFTAGNFTYRLSSTGEILGVAPKTTISIGGYTYSFERSDAFGNTRSRLIRQSSAGTIEVVSSEFYGKTANMHYDYSSGEMFAEFQDVDGFWGLLRFNKDGDIDMLDDAYGVDSGYEIFGIQNDRVIARRTNSGSSEVVSIRARTSTPIAVSVDPIVLEEDDPDTSNVLESTPPETESYVTILGPGGGSSASQTGPGGPVTETIAPIAEEYDIVVAGTEPVSVEDTEVVNGPGGGASEVSIINDHAAEQVGPGGPEIGGTP